MPKTRPQQSRPVRLLKFTVVAMLFALLSFTPELRAQSAERVVTLE